MIRCGWVLTDLAGGGAERIPLRLEPALEETQLEVVLLKHRIEHDLPFGGPPVVALSSGPGSLTSAWAPVLMRAVRKARSLDVLVAGLEWAPTFFAVASGALASKPVVGTVHVDLRRYQEFESVPASWRWAMRRALKRCVAVVAVSEDVRDCVLDFGVEPARIHVIPNPVEPFDLPRQATHGRPRILTVANLKTVKGVDLALRAAARVSDLDFEWTIVGDGPERERLFNLAKELGLSDRTKFVGFQPDPKAFYAAADLFVLPSRTEGFSLAVVEAMAAGLPVVATRCARIVEEHLSGGSGELVPTDDADAMANAITRLLTDPEKRRRLGRAGRERAREFEPRVVAKRYDELLMAVAAEHKLARASSARAE